MNCKETDSWKRIVTGKGIVHSKMSQWVIENQIICKPMIQILVN